MSSESAAYGIATKATSTGKLFSGRRPMVLSSVTGTAVLLVAVGVFCLAFDHAVYRWTVSEHFPGEVKVLLNRVEPFGHGYGVLWIALTAWIVVGINRRQLASLFICSLGSGIVADLVKVFVGRIRPNRLPDGSIGDSQIGLNPLWGTDAWWELFDSSKHSFPSAHTATAFGLAVALSHLFPRGRNWFYTLAGLVAVQRVVTGYHYVSDTLIGAAIGMVVGTLVWQAIALPDSHRNRGAAGTPA